MKKVCPAVSGTAFSPAASMIALVPLHKASLSFPKRRNSVGLGKNSSATLFLSPPPLPPPQPCPFFSLCIGFAFLHHIFSTVAHPDFPHLVVVSFHCLTHPYFLLSSPPPLPLSAPPILPLMLPGTFQRRVLYVLLSILSPNPLTDSITYSTEFQTLVLNMHLTFFLLPWISFSKPKPMHILQT